MLRSLSFLLALVCLPVIAENQNPTQISAEARTSARPLDIALVGGASISEISVYSTASTMSTSAVAPMVGLLLNVPVTSLFTIETGLLYAPRVTNTRVNSGSSFLGVPTSGPSDMTITQRVFEVPVVARLWLGKYFSLGLGGYLSHAVGDLAIGGEIPTTSGRREATNDDVRDRSYEGIGLHKLDYGLSGGVQGRIPLTSRLGILLDTRLNYGLRDLRKDPPAGSTETRGHSFKFLIGGAMAF